MISRTPALATVVGILAAVLVGCPQRQEIIEQTVGAKAEDVVAEAEAGYVPEELLTWEMVAEIDHGFTEVSAVAFDTQSAVHVAGDSAVRRFTRDGQFEWELPVGGEPTCLTVGFASGNICVGLKDRVEVYPRFYPRHGQQGASLVPDGERTWITSVVDTGMQFIVADAGNRRILRYDRSGVLQGEVARMDQERGIPALSVPSPHLDIAGIVTAESSAGIATQLAVANPGRRSIQYHSLADGALLGSWGESSNGLEGFGGCCNPTDIALLPDGRVVTSEKGIPRVKVYSEDGELLSVIVPPSEFLQSTSGIDLATDLYGRVAVVDPERDTVRLYEEKNAAQETADQ